MPDLVYFTDEAGVRYHVLETRIHQGQMIAGNPPYSWATFLVFLPGTRQRWPNYRWPRR